jgi:molybdopterin synthase sulfur carrier subunit
MQVLLFGRLRDIAGWRERDFDPSATHVSALLALIAAEDEALGAALDAPGVRVSVDRVIVNGDAALHPRAEVAFLPPMSGG